MSKEIRITCIDAQLTRDTEMFSNMDPYVIVTCGSQRRKTRTHQEGGKRPKWNDSFTFVNPRSQQIKFAVWDEDNITDDLVGQGSIDISTYLSSPNCPKKQYVTLSYNNRPAGKLSIQIEYVQNGPNNNSWGSNNNSQGWNTANISSNSSWGNKGNSNWGNTSNNSQQQGWNTNANLNGPSNNGSQGWGGNNNQQGWGANNNNNNQQGWVNQGSQQQGWGQQNSNPSSWGQNNAPLNQPSWNANINPVSPRNNPYQQPPNFEKKPSNNNEVNPYGNLSDENNPTPNNYPTLQQNNGPTYGQNSQSPDPMAFMIGAKLFGGQQQQTPPQQQQPGFAMNILDMALNGGVKPQPPTNYGWNGQSGQQNQCWPQQQLPGQSWGQSPQQNWNQNSPYQNQSNSSWGQPTQPNNGWPNSKPNNNGWGSGW